jgi:Phosphotransferase enzyme family
MQAIHALEEELLADLLLSLGGSEPVELTEGGSPARLVKMQTPGGVIVLKLLVDLPGAVDGHDLASFRVKIGQIAKIRHEIPELGGVYTELYDQFHGPNWSAYTMPFYPNQDIGASLRGENQSSGQFWTDIELVLTDLIQLGYLRADAPAPPGHITAVHVDRLARRFWLLRKYLPAGLTESEMLTVNGMHCRNPLSLALVLRDSGLTAPIDPARLYYPVHGDLNSRNILMTAGGYRVIDPRGTIDYWDPAYDLAKLLFSLTVWDGGLRRGFDIDSSGEWRVAIHGGPYRGYREAAASLLGRLRAMDCFAELTAKDPGWESRYLLSHAFHLLAEAACRLSDIKKRASETDAHQISPIELAMGHYLFGVLFLEHAARQLEREGMIDHGSALRLVDA